MDFENRWSLTLISSPLEIHRQTAHRHRAKEEWRRASVEGLQGLPSG